MSMSKLYTIMDIQIVLIFTTLRGDHPLSHKKYIQNSRKLDWILS